MDSEPHLIVKLTLRPQQLHQLKTTSRIWPRMVTILRLRPQHLWRLHQTGRIMPRSMPPDQGIKPIQPVKMETQSSKNSACDSGIAVPQHKTQASPQSTWHPQIPTPPQQKAQPSNSQQRPPQQRQQHQQSGWQSSMHRPAMTYGLDPPEQDPTQQPPTQVRSAQLIRPQQRLYQRPPREMRTHQPGHRVRRYRSPPRRPLHPQNGPGRPWILQSPAEPLPSIPGNAGPVYNEKRRDSRMTLHHQIEALAEQDPGIEMANPEDQPLDPDIDEDLFGGYECRRARALVDGTLVNMRIEYGRDSQSWVCCSCGGIMVDGSQESHVMGCWVGWGAASRP